MFPMLTTAMMMMIIIIIINTVALSLQANYTNRATAAAGEVVATFAGSARCVVSATEHYGR
jgi:hypothetical protein